MIKILDNEIKYCCYCDADMILEPNASDHGYACIECTCVICFKCHKEYPKSNYMQSWIMTPKKARGRNFYNTPGKNNSRGNSYRS